jgi:hypothetical protein
MKRLKNDDFLVFTERQTNEMEGDKPAIGRGAKLAALYAERERKKAEGKHGVLCPTRIQGQKDFGSGSGSASKNLSDFNLKKLFLSSRKYDPGCSSRIRIIIFIHTGAQIQGSKRYRIPDPDPQHWPYCLRTYFCVLSLKCSFGADLDLTSIAIVISLQQDLYHHEYSSF